MIVFARPRRTNKHYCGRSILSESFILTAAHCDDNFSPGAVAGINIVAGIHYLSERNPVIRQVDQIYILHPNWSRDNPLLSNEIALLHLAEPLNFSAHPFLTRTCLPRMDSSKDVTKYPPTNTTLVAIGWGLQLEDNILPPQMLQQVTLHALPHTYLPCRDAIKDVPVQFCAALYEGGKSK